MPCILSQPCLFNGQCIDDYLGGYTCQCQEGYMGKTCETGAKYFLKIVFKRESSIYLSIKYFFLELKHCLAPYTSHAQTMLHAQTWACTITYAFVLWDSQEKTVTLVRSWFNIKFILKFIYLKLFKNKQNCHALPILISVKMAPHAQTITKVVMRAHVTWDIRERIVKLVKIELEWKQN